jgi:hypothetical protein
LTTAGGTAISCPVCSGVLGYGMRKPRLVGTFPAPAVMDAMTVLVV